MNNLKFQSTFPRGERPKLDGKLTPEQIFQSTFPRGERPMFSGGRIPGRRISIHVPSWGTTAPTGASPYRSAYFNPRSLVGNDVRDACKTVGIGIFQSTFPRGERRAIALVNLKTARDFNPRSLVGNDTLTCTDLHLSEHFNPRSLVGNDYSLAISSCGIFISIHVPSWGTT